jgi:hypothetical protein
MSVRAQEQTVSVCKGSELLLFILSITRHPGLNET